MPLRLGQMEKISSRLPEFRKLSPEQRRELLSNMLGLSEAERETLKATGSLNDSDINRMIENSFTTVEIPVGIATNFLINGRDYLIPMAIEEPSVVAACSNAARIARTKGGFIAISTENIMIGQVQIINIWNKDLARINILKEKAKIIQIANTVSKTLSERGKGAIDIDIRDMPYGNGLVLHLKVDVMDAMGANVINGMCERIAPFLEELTGGEVVLRILSNLTPYRVTRAYATFDRDLMGGERVVRRFIEAYELARTDIFRATTHNKGIMNGIDAVLLATLNDWRQAEADAHAFASFGHPYTSMTRYSVDQDGNISGSIEIPLALGTVGGSTSIVNKAKIAMKILNVSSSREFQEVVACVGLAQNFAAVRALSDEGIQKGHMKLHSRNIAASAGAKGEQIDIISEQMIRDNNISMSYARELLKKESGLNE